MGITVGQAEARRPANWLLAPLNTVPARLRWVVAAALTALTVLASAALQRGMESPFEIPDAAFYVRMAKGQVAAVPQPFASRPLAPLLARWIGTAAHVPVETGFIALGWISLLFTLLVVFGLAMRSAAPRWLLLALAVVPFWPQLLHGLGLPDLPYAALLCCLLLCLAAGRPVLAALFLFPLMIARESTSLALVCLLLVGWRQLRWRGCLLAIASTVAGALVVRRLSAGALSNPEHLPEALYLFAKVPWNLLRTAGLNPWNNLYPYLCAPPQRQFALHLGPLRSVGVCSFSPGAPMAATGALLTTFGLLPPLLVLLWIRRSRTGRINLLERFCLLYGTVSFALAPMIGTWYPRLFGYGWPLFLVALPTLFPPPPAETPFQGDEQGRRLGPLCVFGFLLLHTLLAALVLRPPYAAPPVWAGVLDLAGIALLAWRPSGSALTSKIG